MRSWRGGAAWLRPAGSSSVALEGRSVADGRDFAGDRLRRGSFRLVHERGALRVEDAADLADAAAERAENGLSLSSMVSVTPPRRLTTRSSNSVTRWSSVRRSLPRGFRGSG